MIQVYERCGEAVPCMVFYVGNGWEFHYIGNSWLRTGEWRQSAKPTLIHGRFLDQGRGRGAEHACTHLNIKGVVHRMAPLPQSPVPSRVDGTIDGAPYSTHFWCTERGETGMTTYGQWPDGRSARYWGLTTYAGSKVFDGVIRRKTVTIRGPKGYRTFQSVYEPRKSTVYESLPTFGGKICYGRITTSYGLALGEPINIPTNQSAAITAHCEGRISYEYSEDGVIWLPWYDPYSTNRHEVTTPQVFCLPYGEYQDASPDLTVGRDLRGALLRICGDIVDEVNSLPFPQYELVRDAVASVKPIDMNNVENLSSLEFLPRFSGGKAKWLAQLYLWYKYCVSPTFSDVQQIADNAESVVSRFLDLDREYCQYGTIHEATVSGTHIRYNARVRLTLPHVTEMQALSQRLHLMGASISLEHLWDLVPFSFIVDWFLPIGEILSRVSHDLRIIGRQYSLRDIVYSRRGSRTLDAALVCPGFIGEVEAIYYNRSISYSFPPQQYDFGSSNPENHILEGTSLVIANW